MNLAFGWVYKLYESCGWAVAVAKKSAIRLGLRPRSGEVFAQSISSNDLCSDREAGVINIRE